MRKTATKFCLAAAVLCLACSAYAARAQQVDDDLMARRRLFKPVGPGLRSVRLGADGNIYVLASPGNSVSVFNAQGTLLKKIPDYAQNSGPAAPELRSIQFGEDLDVTADGTVYVADRGANAIKIWPQNGDARLIHVIAPLSVAALPEGEVAVSLQNSERLMRVFGPTGKVVRDMGDLEDLSTRPDLNRYLSMGRLASDPQGHVYYGYSYRPEALVRQFDRFGYAGADFEFTGVDALSEARHTRREIERQENKQDPPRFFPILTAFGVDPQTGDVWMCLHNTLLHFDKDGNRRSEYRVYTPDGSRLEANVLVVEPQVLLIGSDPLGVYEFERPDKKQ
jgi:hypothetical protein